MLVACRPAPVPTPPPAESTVALDDRARVAFETGLAALADARYPEALTSFSWALELDPSWDEARWNRVVSLLALRRHDEARAEAAHLDAQRETDATLYLHAWALVSAARYADALELLEARRPRRASASLRLLEGWAAFAVSDLTTAERASEAAVGDASTRADALCLRGAVAAARGEARAAADAWDEALAATPDHLVALRSSGLLLLGGPRDGEARARLQHFLRLAPPGDPDRALVEAALTR